MIKHNAKIIAQIMQIDFYTSPNYKKQIYVQ